MSESSLRTTPVIEVTVAAPIEVVWSALRRPEEIRRWHGWVFDGLDEEVDVIYLTHARESETEDYVLEMAGSGPGDFESGDRFELTEAGPGTRVRIVRGPRPPAESEWAAYYDDVTEGWVSFAHQLRFALERQPGRERRTVFVSAEGTPDPSLAAALGLEQVSPGARVDGVRLGGDSRVGEGWFVSEHQIGVVLDDLGPGLLVAAGGHGKEMLIVSTYGLGDDAFAAITAEVDRFWRSRHAGAEAPTV